MRRTGRWQTGGSLVLTVLLLTTAVALADEPTEAGFQPIFDGRSLDGWLGQDMSFWSVEDGAITGTISAEHAPPMNQYLVYQRALVDNFELKLDFRLTGSTTPDTNGGFQFRSRRLPNGDVAGYQIDNNFGQRWKVRIYDEFGRHNLALQGQRTRFDADGHQSIEPLPLAAGADDFTLDHWHAYHLVADGANLSLKINGHLVATSTDDDPQQFEPCGVLAMQLHTGPPMKAQFRNLRLKPLPVTKPRSPREQLFATAALDWELGDRPGSHQPPLAVHGDVRTELPASGADPRGDATVAELHGGWFDAGPDWNAVAGQLTVYLRAQAENGDWAGALFAKRGGHEQLHFNLFGADLPGEAGTDLGFEIRTDSGFHQVSFPVAEIDPAAWRDLVGRYDGTSLEIFCDGRLMARREAHGALQPNTEPLLIGAETAAGQVVRPFTGRMQRAAVWTRALSDDELRLLSDRT